MEKFVFIIIIMIIIITINNKFIPLRAFIFTLSPKTFGNKLR